MAKGIPATIDMKRAENDKKKKFFDLAVKIKLELPSNHPARTVLVNDLYDEAVSKKLIEGRWADFINDHYSQFKGVKI